MDNNIHDLVESYKILPTKKLGQNFIIDTDVTDLIVSTAKPLDKFNILEIGPGLGTLTNSILRNNPKKLIAVEKDKKLFNLLPGLVNNDRFQVINYDALTIDEREIVDQPVKIIANLPYNIGTKLLVKWLYNITYFDEIIIMLQKEVADKIIAKNKTSKFGRLSVIAQLLCICEKIIDVKPESFFPKPKVDSSVIKLKWNQMKISQNMLSKIEKVSKSAFGQKRKMIRKSLASILDNPTKQLELLNISPESRAEELSIEDFKKIATLL